jgi:molybdopterin-containing oxidoreductase family molybdopterin binding subunit
MPTEQVPQQEDPTDEGADLLDSRFSRRGFLGATAAVGATVAVAASVGGLASGSNPVVRALQPDGSSAADSSITVKEQVYNVVCSQNCWQTCRLEAHVRDGRLVKTAMNPFPESRYNRICLRGLSHAQWVYNPARLKFPMKRVGPRGSGQWRRITWNEAVDTIASSMTSIRDRYGPKAFAIFTGTGNYASVAGYASSALAKAFGATSASISVDEAETLGTFQVGLGSSWLGGNEPLDMSNADLLIMWGNNLTEAQVQEWHFVADAKDRGASLVVIDPNFTTTASKATKWIALRPGSDPAFGLSLLNVLVTEKLYDEPFVIANTTLPFLVRDDDGMFLRGSGRTEILAWDLDTKSARPAKTVKRPALEGSFVVNGVSVRPAFARLSERVALWTPEYAETFTQVPPADVRWLARTYAATKKSFIFPSMGIDRWWNGDMNGRAIATMAALTHNFGQPGAAIGAAGGASAFVLAAPTGAPTGTAPYLPDIAAFDAIDTGKTKILVPLDGTNPANGLAKEPVEVDWPIKAIWFNESNQVSNTQQSKRLIDLLTDETKLELVVVSDSMPTDTVRYADIVLPVTHWFENDDVVGTISHPFALRNERSLPPPFEAKSDYEAFGLVAAKLGFGEYYTRSEKAVADSIMVATAASLGATGPSVLRQYKAAGAARLLSPEACIGNTSMTFATPTGRLEPYSERVLVNYPSGGFIPTSAGVDPLPGWEPPIQAWPDNALYKKYPLVYMTEHTRWRVHTIYFNQPWLREVDPEPYVDLSRDDAKARGIVAGDYVEIFNDTGSTVARARVTGKMRPGMVSVPKGWQRFQVKGDTGYSDPTFNWVNQRTMNGSWFDNLVEVRKVSPGSSMEAPPVTLMAAGAAQNAS